MFYAGDELYDDEVTSGPHDPERDDTPRRDWERSIYERCDAEDATDRQAIEDEYDRESDELQESYRYASRGGRGQ